MEYLESECLIAADELQRYKKSREKKGEEAKASYKGAVSLPPLSIG